MARVLRKSFCGSCALALIAASWLLTVPVGAKAQREKHGLLVLDAKKASQFILHHDPPEYPVLARLNYIQGPVRVSLVVTPDGHVADVHVVRGHPFLAVSALQAIRNWLFRPAQARPGPAEFRTYVDLRFTLRPRKKMEEFPARPEQDLNRQVHPPEVLKRPAASPTASSVRLRVLVGPEGRALDAQPLAAVTPLLMEARRALTRWTFRPARWGAMPVPWYLDVDVPVEPWPIAQSGADPGGR